MIEQIKILLQQINRLLETENQEKEKTSRELKTAALIYDLILGIAQEGLIELDGEEHAQLLSPCLRLCQRLRTIDPVLCQALLQQALALAKPLELAGLAIDLQTLLAKIVKKQAIDSNEPTPGFSLPPIKKTNHGQQIESLRLLNRAYQTAIAKQPAKVAAQIELLNKQEIKYQLYQYWRSYCQFSSAGSAGQAGLAVIAASWHNAQSLAQRLVAAQRPGAAEKICLAWLERWELPLRKECNRARRESRADMETIIGLAQGIGAGLLGQGLGTAIAPFYHRLFRAYFLRESHQIKAGSSRQETLYFAAEIDFSPLLQLLGQGMENYLTGTLALAPSSYQSDWQRYRAQLSAVREQALLLPQADIVRLQQHYTQGFGQLVGEMARDAVALLGAPPCAYALLGLGSYAREEMLPYSDLEFALLVEEDTAETQAYFTALLELLEFKINSLDESDEQHRLGFHLDEAVRPIRDARLYGTPEAIAGNLWEGAIFPEADSGGQALAFSLLRARLLQGEEKLKERYQAALAQALPQQQVLAEKLLRQKQADFNQHALPKGFLEIKEAVIEWLVHPCLLLGACHQLSASPCQEILTALSEKGVLNKQFAQYWWQQLAKAQLLHLKIQRHTGGPKQEAVLPGPGKTPRLKGRQPRHDVYEFTLEEKAWLKETWSYLLMPLYASLGQLLNVTGCDPVQRCTETALTEYASTGRKRPLLKAAVAQVQHCIYRQENSLAYYQLYRRLPEAVRQDWLKKLKKQLRQAVKNQQLPKPQKKHILMALLRCPNADGSRDFRILPQKKWLPLWLSCTEAYHSGQEASYRQQQRVQVEWLEAGKVVTRLLKPEWQQQWLTKTGEFKPELRQLLDGKRIVVPVKTNGQVSAYLKAWPEMPGTQRSVELLCERLSGLSAPSLLMKWTVWQGQTTTTYPVLLSAALPGSATLKTLAQINGSLSHLGPEIDPYALTWHVLQTLLVCPEDDKADNVIACPLPNEQGELRYGFISIDCDHAYVDAFKEKSGKLGRKIKLQLKTLVFCFEAMRGAVDPQAASEFLLLDPKATLDKWLAAVAQYHAWLVGAQEESQGLFTAEEAQRYAAAKPDATVLAPLLETGSLKKIYLRFRRLQAALSEQQLPASLFALVRLIDPRLANTYERSFAEASAPESRFRALPTDYKIIEDKKTHTVTYQSTLQLRQRAENSLTIDARRPKRSAKLEWQAAEQAGFYQGLQRELDEAHGQFQQIAAIHAGLLQGEPGALKAFAQADPYLQERTLKGINFSEIALPTGQRHAWQAEVLAALANAALQEIYLLNCHALTDNLLEKLLKQTANLRVLILQGCKQLKGNVFSLVALYTDQLEKLDLSYTMIPVLQSKVIFTQLRWLSIAWSEVKTLQLRAPQLATFYAHHCAQLSQAQLQSEVLTNVDFTACRQLTDSALAAFVSGCANLQSLALEGCAQVTYREWKEQDSMLAKWKPTLESQKIILIKKYKFIKEVYLYFNRIDFPDTVYAGFWGGDLVQYALGSLLVNGFSHVDPYDSYKPSNSYGSYLVVYDHHKVFVNVEMFSPMDDYDRATFETLKRNKHMILVLCFSTEYKRTLQQAESRFLKKLAEAKGAPIETLSVLFCCDIDNYGYNIKEKKSKIVSDEKVQSRLRKIQAIAEKYDFPCLTFNKRTKEGWQAIQQKCIEIASQKEMMHWLYLLFPFAEKLLPSPLVNWTIVHENIIRFLINLVDSTVGQEYHATQKVVRFAALGVYKILFYCALETTLHDDIRKAAAEMLLEQGKTEIYIPAILLLILEDDKDTLQFQWHDLMPICVRAIKLLVKLGNKDNVVFQALVKIRENTTNVFISDCATDALNELFFAGSLSKQGNYALIKHNLENMTEIKLVFTGYDFLQEEIVYWFFAGHRYNEGNFIVEESFRKQFTYCDINYLLDMLITASLEDYSALMDQWLRTGDILVFCFSLRHRFGFDRRENYLHNLDMIKSINFPKNVFPALFAYDTDIESDRTAQVTVEEIKCFEEKYGVSCLPFNKKTGEGVTAIIENCIEIYMRLRGVPIISVAEHIAQQQQQIAKKSSGKGVLSRLKIAPAKVDSLVQAMEDIKPILCTKVLNTAYRATLDAVKVSDANITPVAAQGTAKATKQSFFKEAKAPKQAGAELKISASNSSADKKAESALLRYFMFRGKSRIVEETAQPLVSEIMSYVRAANYNS